MPGISTQYMQVNKLVIVVLLTLTFMIMLSKASENENRVLCKVGKWCHVQGEAQLHKWPKSHVHNCRVVCGLGGQHQRCVAFNSTEHASPSTTSWTVQPFLITHHTHKLKDSYTGNNIQDVEQSPAYHGSAHCECYLDVLEQSQDCHEVKEAQRQAPGFQPVTHQRIGQTAGTCTGPGSNHWLMATGWWASPLCQGNTWKQGVKDP